MSPHPLYAYPLWTLPTRGSSSKNPWKEWGQGWWEPCQVLEQAPDWIFPTVSQPKAKPQIRVTSNSFFFSSSAANDLWSCFSGDTGKSTLSKLGDFGQITEGEAGLESRDELLLLWPIPSLHHYMAPQKASKTHASRELTYPWICS